MSCAAETATLDRFFEMLALCEDKVTYGPKSVEIALREMAVETLLISDKLFRAKNIEQRKFYVGLYEQATRDGLNVVIFGSMNAAGVRLNGLTGIAAILRFELPALQDMVDEDEGHLDSEEEGEMGESDSEEETKSHGSKKPQEEETKSGHKLSDKDSTHEGGDHFLEDVFHMYGDELANEFDISYEDFDGADKSTFKAK